MTTSLVSTERQSSHSSFFRPPKPMAISTITSPPNATTAARRSALPSPPGKKADSTSSSNTASPTLHPSSSDSPPPFSSSSPSIPSSPECGPMPIQPGKPSQHQHQRCPPLRDLQHTKQPYSQRQYHHQLQQQQSTASTASACHTHHPHSQRMNIQQHANYSHSYHRGYSYYPHSPVLLGNTPGSPSEVSSPLSLYERRQRNKTASAKYRAKKNQQHGEMRSMIATLSKENELLMRQLDQARAENNRLKSTCDKLRGKMMAEKMLNKILQEKPDADDKNKTSFPSCHAQQPLTKEIDLDFDLDEDDISEEEDRPVMAERKRKRIHSTVKDSGKRETERSTKELSQIS